MGTRTGRSGARRRAAIAGLVAFLAALQIGGAVETSLAFVDLDEVFNSYWKTKQADRALQLNAQAYRQEREAMMADFQAQSEKLTQFREAAGDATLTEAVRNENATKAEEALQQLQTLQERISTFDQEQQAQLDRQKQRMRTTILKDITDALERIGRTEGYTAIVDSSGFSFNGVPVIIYSDQRFDITRQVTDLLNLGGPAAAGGAAGAD